jgi:23S rRNA (cytosine1962-C5)-methyltransferase
MEMISPQHFTDYELLDCGGYEKLERFGAYVLRRPEPKAIWAKDMSEQEWKRSANASFVYGKGAHSNPDERGEWRIHQDMPQSWLVHYKYAGVDMRLRLALTAFKHVGIFPEQADNWNYIYERCSAMEDTANVLNLFAYTGAATMAARAGNVYVTHLDAVRQVVTWANTNSKINGMEGIRWLVDDAVKFVEREVRRGVQYGGIILDPPAYGRGPGGERWLLQDGLLALLQSVRRILMPSGAFLLLNLYSLGASATAADTLVRSVFSNTGCHHCGELGVVDNFGKRLPLSVYVRSEFA